ncbi:hypothetical protein K438DRAFT_2181668 [Mycena galopus ATCC 62051]|nr:hypothetical protein K438DRAFT_2181668 [Mycena galopus ATCC 62051]
MAWIATYVSPTGAILQPKFRIDNGIKLITLNDSRPLEKMPPPLESRLSQNRQFNGQMECWEWAAHADWATELFPTRPYIPAQGGCWNQRTHRDWVLQWNAQLELPQSVPFHFTSEQKLAIARAHVEAVNWATQVQQKCRFSMPPTQPPTRALEASYPTRPAFNAAVWNIRREVLDLYGYISFHLHHDARWQAHNWTGTFLADIKSFGLLAGPKRGIVFHLSHLAEETVRRYLAHDVPVHYCWPGGDPPKHVDKSFSPENLGAFDYEKRLEEQLCATRRRRTQKEKTSGAAASNIAPKQKKAWFTQETAEDADMVGLDEEETSTNHGSYATESRAKSQPQYIQQPPMLPMKSSRCASDLQRHDARVDDERERKRRRTEGSGSGQNRQHSADDELRRHGPRQAGCSTASSPQPSENLAHGPSGLPPQKPIRTPALEREREKQQELEHLERECEPEAREVERKLEKQQEPQCEPRRESGSTGRNEDVHSELCVNVNGEDLSDDVHRSTHSDQSSLLPGPPVPSLVRFSASSCVKLPADLFTGVKDPRIAQEMITLALAAPNGAELMAGLTNKSQIHTETPTISTAPRVPTLPNELSKVVDAESGSGSARQPVGAFHPLLTSENIAPAEHGADVPPPGPSPPAISAFEFRLSQANTSSSTSPRTPDGNLVAAQSIAAADWIRTALRNCKLEIGTKSVLSAINPNACAPPIPSRSRFRVTWGLKTEIHARLWVCEDELLPITGVLSRAYALGCPFNIWTPISAADVRTVQPIQYPHIPALPHQRGTLISAESLVLYLRNVREVFSRPHARAAFLASSLLWRIAVEWAPRCLAEHIWEEANPKDGPVSFDSSIRGAAPCLSQNEIDTLLGMTTASVQLWPPLEFWHRYDQWTGQWSSGNGGWFVQRAIDIRTASNLKNLTRNRTVWRSRLHIRAANDAHEVDDIIATMSSSFPLLLAAKKFDWSL